MNSNLNKIKPRSIAKDVILTLITCGLWSLYWQYAQIRTVNSLLQKKEFSFWKWFVLTLITCGLYHIYYEYVMGRAIVKIQHKYGLPPSESLPIVSIIVTLLSFGIIADAIQQKELNTIIEEISQIK